MNYWPLSKVMQKLRYSEHMRELASLGTSQAFMSESGLYACRVAASELDPCGSSMVLIYSEGASTRRVYLERPTDEHWKALERGGFVTAFNNFGFVMDALH